MSAQIGNILKNHEHRIRELESKLTDYNPSDILMKEDLESVSATIDTLTTKNNEVLEKMEHYEKKYNEVLELFALQHKEFLKLKATLNGEETAEETNEETAEETNEETAEETNEETAEKTNEETNEKQSDNRVTLDVSEQTNTSSNE